jgi:hypothetical protein
METKERRALGELRAEGDSTGANYGLIKVFSPVEGIITRIDRQQNGEFVTEGGPLCGISSAGSLCFQLNVPYEDVQFIPQNRVCSVILPDGHQLKATITKSLTQASPGVQTISYLAEPVHPGVFLPENLLVTARFIIYKKDNAQLLPKQAVLSDELMQHFWVMRVVGDGMAVKVAVTPGEKNDSMIEILQPVFPPYTGFVTSGNYGLPDTAAIKIESSNSSYGQ